MRNESSRPTAWVCLDAGYTLRWRRGDHRAAIFAGRRIVSGDASSDALVMIPVSPDGWVDLAEVRRVAERWVRQLRRGRER